MKKIYNAPFNIKAQASGEISCVFATLEVWDHDNDFTVPGAFGTQGPVPLEAWNHNYMQLPVGQGRIYEKGNDAIFEGNFFLDTQAGHDHYETLRQMNSHEYPQEFSYSFDVLRLEKVTHDGKPGQRLLSLKVLGIAPVQRGAGINTRLLSIKGAKHNWLPFGLSPSNARAQISELMPPQAGELRKVLDDSITSMQDKEFIDLQQNYYKASGSPSILELWRRQLLAEGHSERWVDEVLAGEVAALARRFETNAFAPLHEPGWALREALRILNAPPVDGRPLSYPEIGGNATSPLVFV